MEEKKEGNFSLLNKYTTKLMKLREFIGDPDGEFWYRGQRDKSWHLTSGAIQRIIDSVPSQGEAFLNYHEELIEYHEDLLETARLIGGNWNANGRELSDLELLAQLQHYGAATCLLDMTSSFNIALWFACQKTRGRGRYSSDRDGMVFVVPVRPINTQIDFLKVRSDEIEETVDYFLDPNRKRKGSEERGEQEQIEVMEIGGEKPRFWRWEPRHLMGRMASQASRFIISSYDISQTELYEGIKIKAGDKEGLLWELEQQQGLKPYGIFSDIPGLASVSTREMPYRSKKHEAYLQAGKRKLQEGRYEDAIEDLSQADNLEPSNPFILLARGKAQWSLANSGGAHLGREQSQEILAQARKDLERALDLAKEKRNRNLRNQVNEQMKELELCEKGFEDFFNELEKNKEKYGRELS